MSSACLHLGQLGRCLMILTSFRSTVISDGCSFTFLVVGIITILSPWMTILAWYAKRKSFHAVFDVISKWYTSKDGKNTKVFRAMVWLAAMYSHIPKQGWADGSVLWILRHYLRRDGSFSFQPVIVILTIHHIPMRSATSWKRDSSSLPVNAISLHEIVTLWLL